MLRVWHVYRQVIKYSCHKYFCKIKILFKQLILQTLTVYYTINFLVNQRRSNDFRLQTFMQSCNKTLSGNRYDKTVFETSNWIYSN